MAALPRGISALHTANRVAIAAVRQADDDGATAFELPSSAPASAGLRPRCALRQRGFEVALYERAPELGEVGAGLQLGPNAVKVLRALGIEAELRTLAFEPATSSRSPGTTPVCASASRSRRRDEPTIRRALPDGAPRRPASPAVRALPADSIRARRALHRRAHRRGLRRWRRLPTASEIEADVVVGADGINSVVRESLFGPQPARFTQQMAWRCIVPIECVPTRVGPGGAVAIARDEYVGWIGPDGHVICYPIRGGKLYNIFAGHVSEDWVEESWVVPSSVDELLAGYRGWNERAAGHAGASVRAVLQMGHPRPRPAAALDATARSRCWATPRIR